MAAPAMHSISHVAGDGIKLVLTLRDSDDALVNLTGYAAAMQVREYAGGSIWASSTGASPSLSVTLGGAAGTITITGTVSQTSAARGVYDIQYTEPGGTIQTFLAGDFTVIEQVTQ